MRIAQVIGSVTLNRVHASLRGGRFRLATPLTLEDLRSREPSDNEAIVVYDELNSGEGQWIAVSEGREASQPFYPDEKPLDAYNAAILDRVEIMEEEPGARSQEEELRSQK